MADEIEQLKARIQLLENTLREARAGYDILHNYALKGFTDDAVLHCVHMKNAIDITLRPPYEAKR